MSNKKTNSYIVNGKASVCTWRVQVKFLSADQCLKFITTMMKDFDPIPDFTFENNPETEGFIITIGEYSWANNLKILAEMLEDVDFSAEE